MTKSERDKQNIKERLHAIVENEGSAGGYHYEIQEREWENYGKSRTYYTIVETRDNSSRYVEYPYGYYDNNEEKYVAGKNDIEKNYSLGGKSIFDIDEAINRNNDNQTEEVEMKKQFSSKEEFNEWIKENFHQTIEEMLYHQITDEEIIQKLLEQGYSDLNDLVANGQPYQIGEYTNQERE